MRAEPVFDTRCALGESPWWDPRAGELVWVDIEVGRIHQGDPRTGAHQATARGEAVAAIVPRARGGMLAALRASVVALDAPGAEYEPLADLGAVTSDLRFNDGACDPVGRLWIGTMSRSRRAEAALYRLEPEGILEEMAGGLTVSNGLDWSLDGTLLYHVDTPTAGIDVLDFDVGDGTIHGRRRFVDLPDHRPDGMTVDAEGGVWVALFGSAEVRRYTTDGQLDEVVELPTPEVTSCAFGGPGLDELYITTARINAQDDHAGTVLRCLPGVAGRPARAFAG